jgi:single-strand DNA-binding protein
MLNVTIVTGRLVESPELRQTNNGTPVTTFRIAVRRDYVKKDSNDATDFFDVVAWRTTAEFVSKYFKKGSLVQIVGRLENRNWTDKHNQPRVTAEIIADKVYFGEGKCKDTDDGDIDPFDGDTATGSTGATYAVSGYPQGFDPFG